MRWLDDVSMDLRKMGINEWRDTARNRETWSHIVAEAKAVAPSGGGASISFYYRNILRCTAL